MALVNDSNHSFKISMINRSYNLLGQISFLVLLMNVVEPNNKLKVGDVGVMEFFFTILKQTNPLYQLS